MIDKFKRRTAQRLKKREYTKKYLDKKRGRLEEPNNYPFTRPILIKDFLRTPDLYKAIFLFICTQLSVGIIATGIKYPNIDLVLSILSILLGSVLVIYTIREINKRQRRDNTRRRFKLGQSLKITFTMLFGIICINILFRMLGFTIDDQPNQNTLELLIKTFPIATIFTIVIVSPIIEEFIFRELLPFATGPSYLSFIISSIIFILLHSPYGIIGWVSYTILSGVFLYARLKDNNVYSSISVHMVWNLLTVIL